MTFRKQPVSPPERRSRPFKDCSNPDSSGRASPDRGAAPIIESHPPEEAAEIRLAWFDRGRSQRRSRCRSSDCAARFVRGWRAPVGQRVPRAIGREEAIHSRGFGRGHRMCFRISSGRLVHSASVGAGQSHSESRICRRACDGRSPTPKTFCKPSSSKDSTPHLR